MITYLIREVPKLLEKIGFYDNLISKPELIKEKPGTVLFKQRTLLLRTENEKLILSFKYPDEVKREVYSNQIVSKIIPVPEIKGYSIDEGILLTTFAQPLNGNIEDVSDAVRKNKLNYLDDYVKTIARMHNSTKGIKNDILTSFIHPLDEIRFFLDKLKGKGFSEEIKKIESMYSMLESYQPSENVLCHSDLKGVHYRDKIIDWGCSHIREPSRDLVFILGDMKDYRAKLDKRIKRVYMERTNFDDVLERVQIYEAIEHVMQASLAFNFKKHSSIIKKELNDSYDLLRKVF